MPRRSLSVTRLIALADAVIFRLPSLIGLLAVPVAERLAKPWAAEVRGCPCKSVLEFWNLAGEGVGAGRMNQMRRVVARAPTLEM